MDGVSDVVNRYTLAHHDGDFVNEVAGMSTENVGTKNLAIGGNENLDETIVGIHRECLAIGAIERLECLVFCPCLGELLFSLPHHSRFGSGEDSGGNDREGGVVGIFTAIGGCVRNRVQDMMERAITLEGGSCMS